MRDFKSICSSLFLISVYLNMSCKPKECFYRSEDFEKVRKIDAHFHYLTLDSSYIIFAESLNFRILTPIWEGEIPIDTQLEISASIKEKHPESYSFFTAFHSDKINREGFADSAKEYIKGSLKRGASGVKIWKNIGMVIMRPDSTFLMADDTVLTPVFKYLEKNRIPVIAHLGEPKNCWLPLEEMTDPGDADYFRNNPQYHMFLHPEVPSYWRQIAAMENLLRKHPDLDYTGAHLASLEWSIDEVAKRLDDFPNMKVDLAARMFHIQRQSEQDREHVRSFFIKYQERIVYGTDLEVRGAEGKDPAEVIDNLKNVWIAHWNYLATDSADDIKGLNLPARVIDKIYYNNAKRFFTDGR